MMMLHLAAMALLTRHFDDVWDLTAGDMVINFTYNATGIVDAGQWGAQGDPGRFL